MSVKRLPRLDLITSRGTRVFSDTEGVKSEIKTRESLCLRLMLEDIHRKSTPITPLADTRFLRGQVHKSFLGFNKAYIEWSVHYAAVQEKGWRYDPKSGKKIYFRNYTTPGTGAHFAEKSVDQVIANANNYFYLGGLI